jgi:hypothetical protein
VTSHERRMTMRVQVIAQLFAINDVASFVYKSTHA